MAGVGAVAVSAGGGVGGAVCGVVTAGGVGAFGGEFCGVCCECVSAAAPEVVEVGHVHKVGVSVPEQAVRILDMFRLVGPDRWLGFEALTRDCGVSLEVVGRFLALLELYKAQVVVFEQVESLGELKVAWTGVDVDPMVVLAGRWE